MGARNIYSHNAWHGLYMWCECCCWRGELIMSRWCWLVGFRAVFYHPARKINRSIDKTLQLSLRFSSFSPTLLLWPRCVELNIPRGRLLPDEAVICRCTSAGERMVNLNAGPFRRTAGGIGHSALHYPCLHPRFLLLPSFPWIASAFTNPHGGLACVVHTPHPLPGVTRQRPHLTTISDTMMQPHD